MEQQQKKEETEQHWWLAKYVRPLAWVALFLAVGLLLLALYYAKRGGMFGGKSGGRSAGSHGGMKGGCACMANSYN